MDIERSALRALGVFRSEWLSRSGVGRRDQLPCVDVARWVHLSLSDRSRSIGLPLLVEPSIAAGGSRPEASVRRNHAMDQDTKQEEKKVDKVIDMTFPASDPA